LGSTEDVATFKTGQWGDHRPYGGKTGQWGDHRLWRAKGRIGANRQYQ
jgi:hypothetical protein